MFEYENNPEDIVRFQVVTTREIKYKLKGLAGIQGLNLTNLANKLFQEYIEQNQSKLMPSRTNDTSEPSRSNENDVV